jgi:uncharacterized protein (TIGR02996 family)
MPISEAAVMDDVERALLAAIIAEPEDDTPRLVYADWLDEHGRPERAEFIRVQCELARLVLGKESDDQYAELTRRQSELYASHFLKWESEFAVTLPPNRQTRFWFRRGMVGDIYCRVKYFREHGDQVVAAAPLEQLSLRQPTEKGIVGLSELPAFRRVSGLSLQAEVIDPRVIRGLLGVPVEHLRSLDLSSGFSHASPPHGWAERSAGIVERLAASRQFSQLRRLKLVHAGIGDAGGRALAHSAGLAGLKVLLLTGNPLSEATKELLRVRFGNAVYFDNSDYRGRLTLADIR